MSKPAEEVDPKYPPDEEGDFDSDDEEEDLEEK